MMPFNVEALIESSPQITKSLDGRFQNWTLSPDALRYIQETIEPGSATLETGCGRSTVLFAMLSCRHTYIDPCPGIIDRLKDFCQEKKVQTGTLFGYEGRSEDELPFLDRDLDFVLLDGRHAFPTPIVDFSYAGAMLKTGGRLMLDDVDIWSVKLLHQFLSHDLNWELVAAPTSRQVVYKKLGEGTFTNYWKDQAFNEKVLR